jgi:hypothetical protein
MDVPPLVAERLDGESVETRVALGGDDAVFVTPSRTLVYRAEGLLSDESVSAYPHDAERLELTPGRRKTTFELTYVDTAGKFTVPGDRTDAVLKPVIEGVLAANGAISEGERVREAYRFSELTLVVTDGHLLKHVGDPLWDEDFESFPFADVTDFDTEEGSVATQLVIEVAGRPQRIKVPSDESRAVAHTVESAVLAFHGVDSIEALHEATGRDAPDEGGSEEFEEADIDPLVGGGTSSEDDGDVDPVTSVEPQAPGVDDGDVRERLAALEAAVERQNELLEEQRATIETLVEELRRGR